MTLNIDFTHQSTELKYADSHVAVFDLVFNLEPTGERITVIQFTADYKTRYFALGQEADTVEGLLELVK